MSVNCVNSECVTRGSTSPAAMVAGVSLFRLSFFVPRKAVAEVIDGPASLRRRLVAAYTDFFISLSITLPFLAFFFVAVEALNSGEFAWEFSRDYVLPTDLLIVFASLVLTFGFLFF
ncbi:hypothetical protein GCM10007148_03040 [Parvularcula lutaonensis]|nr:hypothetical protein GCM10007148_03040 [Parvularcula lutaonensis]